MSIYEYNEEEHMRKEREDAFKDGREAGLAEGRNEGRSDILDLIAKMTADGMGDMISQLAEDSEFYDEMVKKYIR